MQGDEYILTAEEQAEMGQYLQALADVQKLMACVLKLIIKQQHLDGKWMLSEDGMRLIRPTK